MASSKLQTNLLFNIEANSAELRKGIEQANQHIKGFQKQVSSIGTIIKGAFAATAIIEAGKAIFNFGKEASELAAKAEGIKLAFDALNQPDLLKQMRDAVKGTVDDVTLMKNAVKANEFGIPIEKMGVMMEFAAMQAAKMGESVDFMAESITTGLARGSVQILDNLGLSAKQLREESAKTGDIASAAFNLMNERLKESGGLIETNAVKQARFKAEVQNLKVAFGDLVNKGINAVTPVLMDLWDGLKTMFTSAKKYIVDFINGWIELYNESAAFRLIVESIKIAFKQVFAGIELAISQAINSFKSFGKIIAYVLNPSNWGAGFGDGLKKILSESFENSQKNVQKFAEKTKKNFLNGLENVKNGKAKLIGEEEAEASGKAAAKPFKKGLKDGLATGEKVEVEDVLVMPEKMEEIELFGIDDSNLPEPSELAPEYVGDTYAYWNQELDKYNNRLKNLVIGSKEYTETQNEIAKIQERLNDNNEVYSIGLQEIQGYFGGLQSLSSSLSESVGKIFGAEAQEEFNLFAEGFNNFIGIMQTLMNVFQAINQITTIFNTIMKATQATTVALTAATTAQAAASAGAAAASTSEATADGIAAAAKAGKATAGIPIIGAILAVAAIGAVVASIISARKKIKGHERGGTTLGGSVVVGEGGAEIVDLPVGSRVHSAGRTSQMMNNFQPEPRIIVLDTRLAAGDLWLVQREYEKKIGNTR